jgi:hypothetical protein
MVSPKPHIVLADEGRVALVMLGDTPLATITQHLQAATAAREPRTIVVLGPTTDPVELALPELLAVTPLIELPATPRVRVHGFRGMLDGTHRRFPPPRRKLGRRR